MADQLEEATDTALRLSLRMLKDLERRMDAPAKTRSGELGEPGLENKSMAQFKALGTDLTKNVRAITGMLREARAQAKDAYALFKKMSSAERNEVVVAHVRQGLNVEQKKDLIQVLLADVNG